MEQPIEAGGGGQDTSWVVVSSDWSVGEEIDGPAPRLALGLLGDRDGHGTTSVYKSPAGVDVSVCRLNTMTRCCICEQEDWGDLTMRRCASGLCECLICSDVDNCKNEDKCKCCASKQAGEIPRPDPPTDEAHKDYKDDRHLLLNDNVKEQQVQSPQALEEDVGSPGDHRFACAWRHDDWGDVQPWSTCGVDGCLFTVCGNSPECKGKRFCRVHDRFNTS